MSSCSRSTEVLSYVLGELEGDDKVLFEKHLENCPLCREELRFERILQNGLTECVKPDAAHSELKLNVLKRTLAGQRPKFPFWQVAATLLSGATIFFVILNIARSLTLPEAGIGLLIRFIDEASVLLARADSLSILIVSGIVLTGITTFVVSVLPEK